MIELNNFSRLWDDKRSDILSAVERVGRSGHLILGSEVQSFEASFAQSMGLHRVVGVGNGLDALEIALRALRLPVGAKVLTTPLSAFATTLAIFRAGLVPVFVDVSPTGLMDLDAAAGILEKDTSIRALLPVHLYGESINLDALRSLRSRFGIAVIEDCAQATGTRWRGEPDGRVGDASCWSFYPTKNLGALGDGGAVAFPDEGTADIARSLRNYGQLRKDVHTELGLNSRLDELQAALLHRAFLPSLETWLERRRQTAEKYLRELRGTALEMLPRASASESSWHLFPVLVPSERRDAFIKYGQEQGVRFGVHYAHAIPDQGALKGLPFPIAPDLPNARRIAGSVVSLPVHPYLTTEEADEIIAVCRSWPG